MPTVLTNADSQRRERELKRLDQIVRLSGIEGPFVEASLKKGLNERDESEVSAQALRAQIERSQRAFRCMGPLSYLNLSCREVSVRLAQCPLSEWFRAMAPLDEIKAPSQSELARFTKRGKAQTLVELKEGGMDSTAIQAPIHCPGDWVLLPDATRTPIKAVRPIRKHGLKHRREEPALFLARRNALCLL